MAFDGLVIANLVNDINKSYKDGRISKIIQPEKDEIILTLKGPSGNKRLLLSVNPSLPVAYLTEDNKKAPMQAPAFCMLLRKHLSNGKITEVSQVGGDRIIRIAVSHYNEMGDLTEGVLYAEFMGKYSNIIFCDENDIIIDAIKRISANVSSLREVLPGRKYFIPEDLKKADPFKEISFMNFKGLLMIKQNSPVAKAISASFAGISPLVSGEVCFRAGADPDVPVSALGDEAFKRVHKSFEDLIGAVSKGEFSPNIIYDGDEPVDFCAIHISMYEDKLAKEGEDISAVLKEFYFAKESYSRMRQKSSDLRKLVATVLERTVKKYDIQAKQLKDTEKRDKFRMRGELLTAYAYMIEAGADKVTVNDYNTGKDVIIPLDKDLSPMENANKAYEKYNKLKRTYEALTEQIKQTKEDWDHLLSIQQSIETASSEADLAQIREEMFEAGYVKKRKFEKGAKRMEKAKPLHYISSDGFHMYVGKNNIQNDELTFKFANGGDWWFHAKQMPGSHVVVKTEGRELTDRAYEEAGALAAYYSAGKDSPKVEIDYLERKNVKKPNGAKPGYVIYYTNYSLTAVPGLDGLTEG